MDFENNQGVLLLAAGQVRPALQAFARALQHAKDASSNHHHDTQGARLLNWVDVEDSLRPIFDTGSGDDDDNDLLVGCGTIFLVPDRRYAACPATNVQIRSSIVVYNMAIAVQVQGKPRHPLMQTKALRLYTKAYALLQGIPSIRHYSPTPCGCLVHLLRLCILYNQSMLMGISLVREEEEELWLSSLSAHSMDSSNMSKRLQIWIAVLLDRLYQSKILWASPAA